MGAVNLEHRSIHIVGKSVGVLRTLFGIGLWPVMFPATRCFVWIAGGYAQESILTYWGT
jgi:hypothetical protein